VRNEGREKHPQRLCLCSTDVNERRWLDTTGKTGALGDLTGTRGLGGLKRSDVHGKERKRRVSGHYFTSGARRGHHDFETCTGRERETSNFYYEERHHALKANAADILVSEGRRAGQKGGGSRGTASAFTRGKTR